MGSLATAIEQPGADQSGPEQNSVANQVGIADKLLCSLVSSSCNSRLPAFLQDDMTTPATAPTTRQLRHTRSQSARITPTGGTAAKGKQAVEVSNEEDVDILALSSASSAEVDITSSPTVAMSAALHAALPLQLRQEVSCYLLCPILPRWFRSRTGHFVILPVTGMSTPFSSTVWV